jgi:hypothetical protein
MFQHAKTVDKQATNPKKQVTKIQAKPIVETPSVASISRF